MSDNSKNEFDITDLERFNRIMNLSLRDINLHLQELAKKFGMFKEEAKSFENVLSNTAMWKSIFQSILTRIDLNKQFSEEALATERKHLEKGLHEAEIYEAKRLLITQKYIAERTKPANAHPAKQKELTLNEQEELQALNASTLKKTEIWTNLFSSIDKLSKKSINSQISDIESLIKYIKTNKTEGNIPSGFSEEDIRLINEITEGYAVGSDAAIAFVKDTQTSTDSLKKTLKELNNKNHINKIIECFKELKGAAGGSKEELEAVNSILEGFKGVGSAFTEVGKAIDEVGIKAGKTVQTIGTVITKTVSMAGAGASVGGGWGAIIGGVVGLATSLIPALKSTQGLSEATKHYYKSLISVTDELIDKQLELIKVSTGASTILAAEDATNAVDLNVDVQREQLEKYLNSKSKSNQNRFSSKLFKYIRINSSNTQEIADEFYKDPKNNRYGAINVDDYVAKAIVDGRLNLQSSQFLNLKELEKRGVSISELLASPAKILSSYSMEELEALKIYGMDIWTMLDEESQNMVNNIIAGEKRRIEIENAVRESNTGTTFDKLYEELNKLVYQADLTGEKIGKSFEGHMVTAIQNIIKKNYLSKELEKWYDDFSNKMADGDLNEEDANYLRGEYERIVNEGNRQYLAAMKAAGLQITTESENTGQARNATAQGIASMSQDTASELNGNFYALFMTVDGIHKIMQDREEEQNDHTLPTLQEMLEVSRSSNTYLLDIRTNTSHLLAIDENIGNINHHILALRNEGVKIRS